MPSKLAPQSKRPCKHFSKKGSCAFGDNCDKSHVLPSSSRKDAVPQRAHIASSTIASPKPQHPTTSPSMPGGSTISRSPTPPDQETLEQPKPSRPPPVVQSQDNCAFYPIGMCENGDDCEFFHEGARPSRIPDPRPPLPPPTATASETRMCRQYLKGKCRKGDSCNYVHKKYKDDSAKESSPVVETTPTRSAPSIARDQTPSPAPPTASATYRPTSPFGYQGIATEVEVRAPKRPDTPPESDDKDRFVDAGEDEEEQSTTMPSFILNAHPSPQSHALPAESPTQARVYPIVEAPKPVPYVTEIVPHWSQFADPKADGAVPFCKQLAQNQCILGDQCRFRHSLTIDEYTMLFKDLQPNMWTISRSNNQPQVVSSPPTTVIVSPPPTAFTEAMAPAKVSSKPPVVKKKVCDFYPLGKCKNGLKCPYAHVGTPPPPADSHSQESTKLCRNLEIDGVCKYGAKCYYSHDIPSTSQTQEEEHGDSGWGGTSNENGWGEETPSGGAEDRNDRWSAAPGDDDNRWGPSHDTQVNDGWSASGNGSRPLTRPGSRACFDFSAGKCRRSNCRFLHDRSTAGESGSRSGRDSTWSGSEFSSEARRRRGTCHDFQQGGCSRGDRCRFAHDEPSGRGTAPNHSNWDVPADTQAYESWGPSESLDDQASGGDNAGWPAEVEAEDPVDEPEGQEQAHAPDIGASDDFWGEQANEDTQEWGDVGVADVEVVKIQKPCKAFGQGVCLRGDSCRYLHELPEDQVPYHDEANTSAVAPEMESQEQVEESREDDENAPPQSAEADIEDVKEQGTPETEADLEPRPDINLERFMYHCTVSFNNRCAPYAVMTAADSCKILLSNLPPDSNIAEIRTLADGFGLVKDVVFLLEAADSVTASIEYADPNDATTAVKQLNDQLFASRPISAKLDSRTPVFARSPLHSQMLMVSWPGPTLVAWAYYPSISVAKAAAAKFDKATFMGKHISAFFDRPPKKAPYPVRLTGLPPGATKVELDAFCNDPKPNLTTLGEPSYTESPEDAIRQELEKYGRVEDFRVCSQHDSAFRTIAYVTMQTFSAADEAARALNKTTPKYLGGATFKVQHIYLAGYKVLPEIFECIRDRLGVIRDRHKDACKVLESFDGYTHTVELRAAIEESTAFSEANAELGELVDGSLILDEKQERLWDPYLELSSSAKAIDKINEPNSGVPCFVHCDKRLQCIRVYGSVDGQDRGKKTLLKILKKVAEQCFDIRLDRRAHVGGLIGKGFVALQKSLGANKISLDLVDAKLTVRGNAEDFESAKGVVSELATSTSSSPSVSTGGDLCPFCDRVPISPVKLTCRHAYCQACLQFALASTAKRDFPSPFPFCACIAPLRGSSKSQGEASGGGPDGVVQRCNAPLSYIVVRDMLSIAQEMDYLKAVFVAYVRASGGSFFFCPTPDCSAVHRAGEEGIVVRCPMCSTDVCPRCCKRIHDGSLCEV